MCTVWQTASCILHNNAEACYDIKNSTFKSFDVNARCKGDGTAACGWKYYAFCTNEQLPLILDYSDSWTINVLDINDAPEVFMPALMTVKEDSVKNLVSNVTFYDDSIKFELLLMVEHGTIVFDGFDPTGLNVTVEYNNNTHNVSGRNLIIRGNTYNLNHVIAAMNVLKYTPDADFNGLDKLKMAISDHEFQFTRNMTIRVVAVNDVSTFLGFFFWRNFNTFSDI